MQRRHTDRIDPIIEEDEIDIKEIFSTILRYKKSILLITAITTMYAFFHAYFSPNIYQAQSMLKLSPHDLYGNRDDFMSIAMGKESSNILDFSILNSENYFSTKIGLKDEEKLPPKIIFSSS